jgi:hypothetical protein
MAGGGMTGHWEGNVGSERYDVYPAGSYSIGDRWYAVAQHLDSPNCYPVATSWLNGALGYYWCGDWVSPIVCSWGTHCDHYYQTRYDVYEFRPAEWQIQTGQLFDPLNPAHGWIFRYSEWRTGQLWS